MNYKIEVEFYKIFSSMNLFYKNNFKKYQNPTTKSRWNF